MDNLWNWDWFASAYMATGLPAYVAIVFMLNAFVVLCLLVGYRTKLNTVLSWFFLCSIQNRFDSDLVLLHLTFNRNLLVGHSGDWLHKILLLISIFLPLGDCFSVDSAFRDRTYDKPQTSANTAYLRKLPFVVIGVPSILYIFQMFIMYYTSYIHKSGPEWTVEGTATWLILQTDFFRRPIAQLILPFPSLCKLLTW